MAYMKVYKNKDYYDKIVRKYKIEIEKLESQPLQDNIKPVPGYFARMVDDKGNVYSSLFKNFCIISRPVKQLRTYVGNAGYVLVSACKENEDGTPDYTGRCAPVHVLVYLAFVGQIPEGKVVAHKDKDPHNNIPSNLYLSDMDTQRRSSVHDPEVCRKNSIKAWRKIKRDPQALKEYYDNKRKGLDKWQATKKKQK